MLAESIYKIISKSCNCPIRDYEIRPSKENDKTYYINFK